MPEREPPAPDDREPVREPGDGMTVEEGVNDPLPPAEDTDPDAHQPQESA